MVNELLISQMSNDFMLPENKLKKLILSAPYRYKVYSIPKRSGKGYRVIAQPAKEVKILQYWIVRNVLCKFVVHDAARAYVKGCGLLSNVSPHCSSEYLMKLDFKDFFYSIKARDFLSYFSLYKDFGYSDLDLQEMVRILFYARNKGDYCLSIGAPSSPLLSNIIMSDFDKRVVEFCGSRSIVYTRYSDDMTFSMSNSLLRREVFFEIKRLLDIIPYPKLKLNEDKTLFLSKANKRMVTGLVLSNDGCISIGHDKKRVLRSKIYKYTKGHLDVDEVNQLKGMLAYVNSVEPEFIYKMKIRYGDLVIF